MKRALFLGGILILVLLQSMQVFAGELIPNVEVLQQAKNGDFVEVTARVSLMNETEAPVFNVLGEVKAMEEGVSFVDSQVAFGDLADGQQVVSEDSFIVTIDTQKVMSMNVSMQLELSYGMADGQSGAFSSFVMIGLEQ